MKMTLGFEPYLDLANNPVDNSGSPSDPIDSPDSQTNLNNQADPTNNLPSLSSDFVAGFSAAFHVHHIYDPIHSLTDEKERLNHVKSEMGRFLHTSLTIRYYDYLFPGPNISYDHDMRLSAFGAGYETALHCAKVYDIVFSASTDKEALGLIMKNLEKRKAEAEAAICDEVQNAAKFNKQYLTRPIQHSSTDE